ncbi:MAG: NrdH-redoxin [Actinomycetia bacterium]|nr:NrdH-redoxin [Actinomycetes bacterium]
MSESSTPTPNTEPCTDETVEFYWRPGCGFCIMLDRNLGRHDIPLEKHNIWDDPDAAAFVRSVANGSETVPTVRIGEVSLVSPSADQVLTILSEQGSPLVPNDWEPRQGGAIGRMIARILGSPDESEV